MVMVLHSAVNLMMSTQPTAVTQFGGIDFLYAAD